MPALKVLLTGLCCCCASLLFGQDHNSRFKDFVAKQDTAGQAAEINAWRKDSPNDAELYVALFNYYVNKSMTEVLNLSTAQSGEKSLVITDPVTKKIAGYLNNGTTFNAHYLNRGFASIDTGIVKYPNRLDMRFGKTYMYGKINDYASFTREIVKTINETHSNKLQWTWADNKPVDDPKKFMLSSIQDYQMQLYRTGNDEDLKHMRTIAEAVLKYYPDHVESLSNLSITYLLQKDFKGALPPLLKAEKIAPTDFIVLNNIAYCYGGLNDIPNAIKYYDLVLKYGDADAKAGAAKKLQELKREQP